MSSAKRRRPGSGGSSSVRFEDVAGSSVFSDTVLTPGGEGGDEMRGEHVSTINAGRSVREEEPTPEQVLTPRGCGGVGWCRGGGDEKGAHQYRQCRQICPGGGTYT